MKKLFLATLLLCVTSPVFGAIAGGEYTIGPGQTYSDMDDFRDNGLALGLLGDTTGWINATYTETSTVEWDLHTGTTFQLFIDVKPEFRNTTGI